MNTEELLKDRYKVIADYPNSPYTVGDVYKFKKKLRNSFYEKENGFSQTNLYAPEKYPHLFRKLEWWEERTIDEMPEYVRDNNGRILNPKHFLNSWGKPVPKGCTHEGRFYSYSSMLPSTETEYLTYKQSKK